MTTAQNELDDFLNTNPFLLDKEEARLLRARREIREIAAKYDPLLSDMRIELASNSAESTNIARAYGRTLVSTATSERLKNNQLVDDRPLYWARLLARVLLRHNSLSLGEGQSTLVDKSISTLEYESRRSPNFIDNGNRKHSAKPILLTCFDPFKLDANIAQTNPSAAVALTLASEQIYGHEVKSLVFPVRYSDFDAQIVEHYCSPSFVSGPRLALTISMGRDQFDLERFPGRRRSAPMGDNAGAVGPQGGKPVPCIADSPEFVEFTLPAEEISKIEGTWAVNDNRRVTTDERGAVIASSLEQLEGSTAIEGSGGGYLSNEISYRTRYLQQKLGLDFPLGHLHVPKVDDSNSRVLSDMLIQTRQIIVAALEATEP